MQHLSLLPTMHVTTQEAHLTEGQTWLCPHPTAECFKDTSTAPAQPPCQQGSGVVGLDYNPSQGPETQALGTSLLLPHCKTSHSLGPNNCKMGRQPHQVLPCPRAVGLKQPLSSFTEPWGPAFRKLHKHPSEKQKSNLKMTFFKAFKKPFL